MGEGGEVRTEVGRRGVPDLGEGLISSGRPGVADKIRWRSRSGAGPGRGRDRKLVLLRKVPKIPGGGGAGGGGPGNDAGAPPPRREGREALAVPGSPTASGCSPRGSAGA